MKINEITADDFGLLEDEYSRIDIENVVVDITKRLELAAKYNSGDFLYYGIHRILNSYVVQNRITAWSNLNICSTHIEVDVGLYFGIEFARINIPIKEE